LIAVLIYVLFAASAAELGAVVAVLIAVVIVFVRTTTGHEDGGRDSAHVRDVVRVGAASGSSSSCSV
jgi:hypothetical protein